MTRFHSLVTEGSESAKVRKYTQVYKDALACFNTVDTTDEPNASILQMLKYLDRVDFLDIHAEWYDYLINYPTCMRMDIDTLLYAERRMNNLKDWLIENGALRDDGTIII